MRALFAVLLLLALPVVFLPHSATAATDCQRATCSASFERTISTNAWGVTTVSDYVNLTSAARVTPLTIGIPASVSDKLRFQPDHGFCRASILQPWREQLHIRSQPLPARRRHLQRY